LDPETASALFLPAVESLKLYDPDSRAIARLALLPKLTSLQLREEDSDREDAGDNVEQTILEVQKNLRVFPALLELNCGSNASFPDGFEDYPRDSFLHNLTFPSLTSLKLEDASPVLNMPNLQKLDLWLAYRHKHDLSRCFISVPSLTSLRAHAEGCFLDANAFSQAVRTGLETLDETVDKSVSGTWKQLQTLHLDCVVSASVLAALAQLPMLCQLTIQSPVEDFHALVSSLRGFSALERLSIFQTVPAATHDDSDSSGTDDEEDLLSAGETSNEDWRPKKEPPQEHKKTTLPLEALIELPRLQMLRLQLLDSTDTNALNPLRLPQLRRLCIKANSSALLALLPHCKQLEQLRITVVSETTALDELRISPLQLLEIHSFDFSQLESCMLQLLPRCKSIARLSLSCLDKDGSVVPQFPKWAAVPTIEGLTYLSFNMAASFHVYANAIRAFVRVQNNKTNIYVWASQLPAGYLAFRQKLQQIGVDMKRFAFRPSWSIFDC